MLGLRQTNKTKQNTKTVVSKVFVQSEVAAVITRHMTLRKLLSRCKLQCHLLKNGSKSNTELLGLRDD